MEKTADGVEITPGLRVWNADVRRSVVVGPDRDYGDGWFAMAAPDGNRMAAMTGDRMATRHPVTGERA